MPRFLCQSKINLTIPTRHLYNLSSLKIIVYQKLFEGDSIFVSYVFDYTKIERFKTIELKYFHDLRLISNYFINKSDKKKEKSTFLSSIAYDKYGKDFR